MVMIILCITMTNREDCPRLFIKKNICIIASEIICIASDVLFS